MSFVLSGVPEFLGYIYLYRHNLAFRGHGIPSGFEKGACAVEIPGVTVKKKEEFSGVFKKNL